ncbi:MAG: DEAD/DEAH box helicase [Desulfobulbaceae bacterium]|nr:DEAD/DEAH box helicase [Desulfobulbaceae bacterium]
MLKRVHRLLGSAAKRLNRLANSSTTVYHRLSRSGGKKQEKSPAPIAPEAAPSPEVSPAAAGREEAIDPAPRPAEPAGATGRKRRRGQETSEPEWSIDDFVVDPLPGKSRFHDFAIDQRVMRGIAEQNFRYCTPIQQQGLPTVLTGRDLIARAQTGTGKTAVFLIGVFCRLLQDQQRLPPPGHPRALVIAPTRELVIQIVKEGQALGAHAPLQLAAVYGGSNLRAQEEELRSRRTDMVVATPGRLLDFLRRRVLVFDRCTTLVIDEADRMLDMGFLPDVRRILSQLPDRDKRQTMLFSATISDDVRRLADRWCRNPVSHEAGEQSVSVDKIAQRVYLTTAEEKFGLLYNLIKSCPNGRILIFENMKSDAARLADRLGDHGIDSLLLTGDVPQPKRLSRLEAFRSGSTRVMVATDVAGRGIHVDDIIYVVNYTLPEEPENYVHRIGRTGRAGAKGVAVSFACEKGSFVIPDIEEFTGRPLPCLEPEEDLLTPVPPRTAARQRSAKRRRKPRRKSTDRTGEGNQR